MNFAQQPTIEFPQELRSLGFTDESWKNDACARALLLKDGIALTVWCDEVALENRESGGSRYTLIRSVAKTDQEAYEVLDDMELSEVLIETEKIDEVVRLIGKQF